jgi:hypothetical protein
MDVMLEVPFYFFYLLIAQFGFCYVVGHSAISLPIRERVAAATRAGEWFVELLECPACLGWWLGFLTGVVMLISTLHAWREALALPFFVSGTNYLLGRATGWIKESR